MQITDQGGNGSDEPLHPSVRGQGELLKWPVARSGEGWAPPGDTALDTLHDNNNQNQSHTGSAVARVTKGRHTTSAPEWMWKICDWCHQWKDQYQT